MPWEIINGKNKWIEPKSAKEETKPKVEVCPTCGYEVKMCVNCGQPISHKKNYSAKYCSVKCMSFVAHKLRKERSSNMVKKV